MNCLASTGAVSRGGLDEIEEKTLGISRPLAIEPLEEMSSSYVKNVHHEVPDYINKYYWWAYVTPQAVHTFERQWLIDLILWGNYKRLLTSALEGLGQNLPGRTLQIACVYGDLIPSIAKRVAESHGTMDVVDILPAQLANLRRKLPHDAPVHLMEQDSSDLDLPDAIYDRVILFCLLHEQPAEVREKTLREAFRVVKPGGTVLVIDFCKPHWWNPLRYFWLPVLTKLEPFAPDLWTREAGAWITAVPQARILHRKTLFGGLYQRILATR